MIAVLNQIAILLTLQTGGEPPAVEQIAPPPAKETAPAAAADSPVPDAMNYTYNPFGKRDPFRPFILDKSADADRNADPLLNFDLSKFQLTGILYGISNPRALVRDGEGKGHVITRGTKIGRNRGSVLRILKNEVVVAEEFRDPLGKLIVSEYVMKLSKGEKGK